MDSPFLSFEYITKILELPSIIISNIIKIIKARFAVYLDPELYEQYEQNFHEFIPYLQGQLGEIPDDNEREKLGEELLKCADVIPVLEDLAQQFQEISYRLQSNADALTTELPNIILHELPKVYEAMQRLPPSLDLSPEYFQENFENIFKKEKPYTHPPSLLGNEEEEEQQADFLA